MYKKRINKWLFYCSKTNLKCKICGERLLLFYDFDADFCPKCNVWVTPNCGDPLCPFCNNRPPNPEHALLSYDLSLDYARYIHDNQKQKAMRHFVFNQKYKNKK